MSRRQNRLWLGEGEPPADSARVRWVRDPSELELSVPSGKGVKDYCADLGGVPGCERCGGRGWLKAARGWPVKCLELHAKPSKVRQ